MNDIKINLPVGGVVTYQPTGIGGMEVTVTVPKPKRTITVDFAESRPSESVARKIDAAHAAPPQTEAERLVDFAKGLPEAVWVGSGYINPRVIDEDWIILVNPEDGGESGFSVAQFRTILLGVMAAYVGTEPGACVWQARDSSSPPWRWDVPPGPYMNDAPDLLTAYRDCCLAIARKRGGA